MKHQKSPIPFVAILLLMIIGLPMADNYFQSDLKLNKSIQDNGPDKIITKEDDKALLAVLPDNVLHFNN